MFVKWWYTQPKVEEKVKCEDCKHYIDKGDAQRVVNNCLFQTVYYCPMHKRPYDMIEEGFVQDKLSFPHNSLAMSHTIGQWEKVYYKLVPAVPEYYEKIKYKEPKK